MLDSCDSEFSCFDRSCKSSTGDGELVESAKFIPLLLNVGDLRIWGGEGVVAVTGGAVGLLVSLEEHNDPGLGTS